MVEKKAGKYKEKGGGFGPESRTKTRRILMAKENGKESDQVDGGKRDTRQRCVKSSGKAPIRFRGWAMGKLQTSRGGGGGKAMSGV